MNSIYETRFLDFYEDDIEFRVNPELVGKVGLINAVILGEIGILADLSPERQKRNDLYWTIETPESILKGIPFFRTDIFTKQLKVLEDSNYIISETDDNGTVWRRLNDLVETELPASNFEFTLHSSLVETCRLILVMSLNRLDNLKTEDLLTDDFNRKIQDPFVQQNEVPLAVMIERIDDRVRVNNLFNDDDNWEKWFPKSMFEVEKQFPFWSKEYVNKLLDYLINEGFLLVSDKYDDDNNYVKHYALNYELINGRISAAYYQKRIFAKKKAMED